MKIIQKISENVTIEVVADTLKQCLGEIGDAMEVYSHSKCGCCGSMDVVATQRTAKGFDFYETVCQNPSCNHRLQFGQTREGERLFAKTTTQDGQPLAHGGWVPPFRQPASQTAVSHTASAAPGPASSQTLADDDIPF